MFKKGKRNKERKEGKKSFSLSSASPPRSVLILCPESGRRSSIYILLSVPLGRLDKKGRQPFSWIFVSFTLSRFEREKENMY